MVDHETRQILLLHTDRVWWRKIGIAIAFSKDLFNKKNTFLNATTMSKN
jgi:hypothetical protein